LELTGWLTFQSQVSSPSADFGNFDWKKQWYPVAFDEYTDKVYIYMY